METPTDHDSDDRLIDRVQAGDNVAFQKLFERHKDLLLPVIRGRLGPRAQDEMRVFSIINLVFFKLSRAIRNGNYDPNYPLLPYLLGIVQREIVNDFRAEARHPREKRLGDPSDDDPVDGRMDDQERRERVDALLARLPPLQAQLLRLRYLECWGCSQIASHLHIPVEAVYRLLHQALVTLRKLEDAQPCSAGSTFPTQPALLRTAEELDREHDSQT
jgi:RNA polymerase sigma-70 factor (ECF subfamily)